MVETGLVGVWSQAVLCLCGRNVASVGVKFFTRLIYFTNIFFEIYFNLH